MNEIILMEIIFTEITTGSKQIHIAFTSLKDKSAKIYSKMCHSFKTENDTEV